MNHDIELWQHAHRKIDRKRDTCQTGRQTGTYCKSRHLRVGEIILKH